MKLWSGFVPDTARRKQPAAVSRPKTDEAARNDKQRGSLRRRRADPVGAAALAALLVGAAGPARAADQLLFCNQPERIKTHGAYANAPLKAGKTYRVFFHYRNNSGGTGPVVVAIQGTAGKPLALKVQKGIADPHRDPARAGRQAMARFMQAPVRQYRGERGGVRFPLTVKPLQVASGVLTVQVQGQDARLRIYYGHNRTLVPGARVVAIDAPRRDFTVALDPTSKRQYFRIGKPEAGMSKHLDGTYGMVYSFRVQAPPGSKVRVAFSPRGGQAGIVGMVGGILHKSRIVGAAAWTLLTEAAVGKDGLVVTTLPFGGVFYPVELAFHLL